MKSIIRFRVYRNCPHCSAELKWWQMMAKVFFCNQCKQKVFRNISNRQAYVIFLLTLIFEFTLLIYVAYLVKNDLFKEPFWFYTVTLALCLIYCSMIIIIVMRASLGVQPRKMGLGMPFVLVGLFFLAANFIPKFVIYLYCEGLLF